MSLNYLVSSLDVIANKTETAVLKNTCLVIKNQLINDNEVTNFNNIIKDLSKALTNFDDVKLFGKYLTRIILQLISIKIPCSKIDFNSTTSDVEVLKQQHLRNCIILSILIDNPDILLYTSKYLQQNPLAPFEVELSNQSSKKRRLLIDNKDITDYDVVSCSFKLLKSMPNEASLKWNWSKFIENYGGHNDIQVKLRVIDCLAILTKMTERQLKQLVRSENINDIVYSCHSLLEDESCKLKEIVYNNIESDMETNFSSDTVIDVNGIMLSVNAGHSPGDGCLIPVNSTMSNLRSLALAVASGKAALLMGPVGSGKTSLVEHLANLTGRQDILKKVQLGDQTDSRMLLGTYQCTDVPGEFVWRPGVLTEAVQNGYWLLLEDIDSAALDVASVLSSLLERSLLSVPGYRDSLPVNPGFQLFVTQRTVSTHYGFQKKISNTSTLINKHLTQINIEPLSRNELSTIIQTLYPQLTTIASKMVEVFMMFSFGCHDSSLHNTDSIEIDKSIAMIRGNRLISTRDLLKWCSRSVVGYEVTSSESALKVLQDAIDIFTCSVSKQDDRLALAKQIGTCLGIVETKSEYYCKHYKPNVVLNPQTIEIGRARLKRRERSLESIDFTKKEAVFSFTRTSSCLLERIACCVMAREPVLLVGETGTGKTSSVQYLAHQTGNKLVVINMNQQSDSSDLLGGYKPVDLKYLIVPLRYEFEDLFRQYFDVKKNLKFLSHIKNSYESENWSVLVALMMQTYKAAIVRLNKTTEITSTLKKLRLRWISLGSKIEKVSLQVKAAANLTFAFIEGSLIKAMQNGHWVLLDEINLASAEILECIAGLLEDRDETVELLEKGDKVPIKKHKDFTLFACMNPATDVGKKELPVGLRNRFTEFFVDELTDKNDLVLLVGDYLYHMNLDRSILEEIYTFYIKIRKESKLNLVDGSGQSPYYSLRTLCRALMAAAKANCGTVSRSLYEAFCLSFLTQLDHSSHPKVEAMIAKAVIGKKELKSVLKQSIPEPQTKGQMHLNFEGQWIPQGKLEKCVTDGYVLTPTVRKNLRDIARVISLGKLPVLLQGDTSVGKTSLITYIAKASGNYCVRINNHEHTDLQEYIGAYATDSNGKLVFKEGVLVEAMRKGYWIILDELNLAPSDVLEALNRVLDDNRELYIVETQQVVKAHSNFMLFATQNPPGLYGGRKMLSRAFRNRFVELHFDEIPRPELEIILHQRCHMPNTYCKKMISVMAELQLRRRGSAAVQGKDGFITLRDLFRWGQRYKLASNDVHNNSTFYDWDQHIADEGYLVLAGKVRQPDERSVIQEVLEKHIKRKVDPNNLFTLNEMTSTTTKHILAKVMDNKLNEFSHLVWTLNMRRLAVLIAKSFEFNEPVLLVGETGCGKTTICQVLAALKRMELLTVNCHMHTESSDFIGGLRPVRQYKGDGKLFEWVNGPLVNAIEQGNIFLADEISLADDSVIERLNSLLEPERQLLLAERGTDNKGDILVITAHSNFQFIGTMNPGGDYGKKELSPALRNRFTEIWCDHLSSKEDLISVLEQSVLKGISLGNQEDGSSGIGSHILSFTDWLKTSEMTKKFPFSIRDLLSWVNFVNSTVSKGLLDVFEAYVHGACLTFLDCFGTALTGNIEDHELESLRRNAVKFLFKQIENCSHDKIEYMKELLFENKVSVCTEVSNGSFGVKPFYIECGPYFENEIVQSFTFSAPTTGANTLRLLRGLQLNKAILLEGNPGVGKTSLVTALAKASGHKVVRINLSDQTDITDLFGTDLPTEDGTFIFKEGVFLTALRNGDWILLDELNLAPQPVLEGLNACLDHRGEVFIPELGKTFKVKAETKIFACQNPLKQGSARRGLPLSFLNRFSQVYVDILKPDDLKFIIETQYPSLAKNILGKIVDFNSKVASEIVNHQLWGFRGSPWEMNLRDIQRWCDALISDQRAGLQLKPGKFAELLYINRMRTKEDKEKMINTYKEYFYPDYPLSSQYPQISVNEEKIFVGDVAINRNQDNKTATKPVSQNNLMLLRSQSVILKSLIQCINMNWVSILVGPTSTGKNCMVQALADLTGNNLHIVPVTSAMDVTDLLGGFEQADFNRSLDAVYEKILSLTLEVLRTILISNNEKRNASNLLKNMREFQKLQETTVNLNMEDCNDVNNFSKKVTCLIEHCKQILKINIFKVDESVNVKRYIEQLIKLKQKVVKAETTNAGGKFEWVDSLLVKCLNEGWWLLLDNVNLTSASVLDRLNGLLEPNGILSIPERGDSSEIKPHPNFRIFFTMDPKYGDISRAMRNRGVEIYILGYDEMSSRIQDSIPHYDLTALLSSVYLPSAFHDLFLHIHEIMCFYMNSYEKPTLTHLLQASNLTYQQIKRGIPPRAAIVNSFADVYIKPRCGNEFGTNLFSLAQMKNILFNKVKEATFNYKFRENYDFDHSHTLNITGLVRDSDLEITRQISYLPLSQISAFKQNPNRKNQIIFINTLNLSYLKCNEKTRCILNHITSKELKEPSLKWIKNINNLIYKTCEELNINDVRFSSEEVSYKDINESNINKLAALLHFTTKNIAIAQHTQNTVTSLAYSKAVLKGDKTDIYVEFPLLKYCSVYIENLDKLVESVLRDSTNSFSNATYVHFIQILNWRYRFYNICCEPLLDDENQRRPKLNETVVTMLYMHFYWIQKYLQCFILEQLPYKSQLRKSFIDSISMCQLTCSSMDAPFKKVSKKIRKLLGQPILYKDHSEFDRSKMRSHILGNMNIVADKSLKRQIYKFFKIDSLLARTHVEMLVADAPSEGTVLKEIEMEMVEIENCVEINIDPYNDNVQMWPVKEYIIMKILSLIQCELFILVNHIRVSNEENKEITSLRLLDKTLLNTIVNAVKNIESFPRLLRCLMEHLCCFINGNTKTLQSYSSFITKFWDEYYKLLRNTPAYTPDAYLSICHIENGSEDIDKLFNSKVYSTYQPMLPNYVIKLCSSYFDKQNLLASDSISLNDATQYIRKMDDLLKLIWNNMATLKISSELQSKSDVAFEMNKYHQLLSYILLSLGGNPLNKSIEILSDECIDLITEFFALQENSNVKDQFILIDHIKIGKLVHQKIGSLINLDNDELIVELAKLDAIYTILLVNIMCELSPIDPVEKDQLKLKYINEDVEMFDGILSVYYIHGLITGAISDACLYNEKDDKYTHIKSPSDIPECLLEIGKSKKNNLVGVHPYCSLMINTKEQIRSKIEKYSCGNIYRPDQPVYYNFVKDCRHFLNSILSQEVINEIYKNLSEISGKLLTTINMKQFTVEINMEAYTVVKKTSTWLYSVNAFYKKVECEYSEPFPDLAKPLLSALSQIQYSIYKYINLINDLTSKHRYCPISHMESLLQHMISFPTNITELSGNGSLCLMRQCLTSDFLTFMLNRSDSQVDYNVEYFNFLKMLLEELEIYSFTYDGVYEQNILHSLLNQMVELWNMQQADIEKKKEEEDSLYVTRSKCEDIEDDELVMEEIAEMFPSFSEKDFVEFKSANLEQNKVLLKQNKNETKPMYLINQNEINFIFNWHSEMMICFSKAEWLNIPQKMSGCDFLSPLMKRYLSFSKLVNGAWGALGSKFETVVSPSLMLFISQIKSKLEGEEGNTLRPDFYHSPWVSEVKQCLPILCRVKEETEVLLNHWPDFPTLKDIMIIVNRILSFPIRSPIARFLTGLELLRDQLEEWNRNAHKGNNMIEVSMSVGAQIIQWRKLEMSHWRECLNCVLKRKQSDGFKYWFYMYNVVKDFLEQPDEDVSLTSEGITNVLTDFMEKSNIAEFSVRLDIVYTFHCHLLHFDESIKRNNLLSIFWNTYNYYNQFSNQVGNYIKEKRAPIEKKLREFVKICTWDRDLSYWSVKDTVDKAHKVLHKHMKEFETILTTSVTVCITLDNSLEASTEHVGIWDRPKRNTLSGISQFGSYMIDSQHYLLLTRKKNLERPSWLLTIEADLLSNVPKLVDKARSLCKVAMGNMSYSSLVQSLDDFVTKVIETSTYLGSLDVDSSETKQKQMSQAKNILQKKRKGLSDLFKNLAHMGLSYKGGMVMLSSGEELYDFTLPPVNFNAALSYFKSRRADKTLCSMWSGCETYYQRNIARHKFLSAALSHPHQDLDLQNIERCKGYAAELMKMTYKQKKVISKQSRLLCELRYILANLTSIVDLENNAIHQSLVNDRLTILSESFMKTSITLEQLAHVLKAIPEKSQVNDNDVSFDHVVTNSSVYQNSENANKLYSRIRDIRNLVSKQLSMLHKVKSTLPRAMNKVVKSNLRVYSQANIETVLESSEQLKNLQSEIEEILEENKLNTKLNDETYVHPVFECLKVLSESIDKDIIELETDKKIMNPVEIESSLVDFVAKCEDVTAHILLSIQNVYKRHLPEDNGEVGETHEKNMDEYHIKQHLQESIVLDMKNTNLKTIIVNISKILGDYLSISESNVDLCKYKDVLSQIVPILELLTMFVEYIVTQQVSTHRVSCKMLSVLMKIFSDLATKGFCKPDSLDMEDGEGGDGPGQMTSGTGLGDGEGQKDVSDRIENQDQLDDAKKPGDEGEKDKDRDCKEEEKGVNMTDDFDSHLQDIEEKEGENDSDQDDEDPDKQMGETDNAAEKLDEQLWGSQDEESDEEQDGKKESKEEEGTGESTGDKQMTAKQDGDEDREKDDGKEGNQDKKKKDFNEMDNEEVDDDQVDPYHGNENKLPEPEAFDLPDNMDIDEDMNEGDTENENPFDLDVMKEQSVPDETEEREADGDEQNPDRSDKDKDNDQLSSDEDEEGINDDLAKDDTKQDEDIGEDQTESGEEQPENQNTEQEIEEQTDKTEEHPNNAESADKNMPDDKDDKNDEDEKPQDPNSDANPSNRDPTAEDRAEGAETEKGTEDNVQTNKQDIPTDDQTAPYEQDQEQTGVEKESKGRSELNKDQTGHQGNTEERSAHAQQAANKEERKEQSKNKPGQTKQDRTLGEIKEPALKRLKTVDVDKDQSGNDDGKHDGDSDDKTSADMFQHIEKAKDDDLQVLDAATKEQAEEQPIIQRDMEEDAEKLQPDEEVPMDTDQEELQIDIADKELTSEKLDNDKESKEENAEGGKTEGRGAEERGEKGAMEVDGDIVRTADAQRGNETTYHTNVNDEMSPTQMEKQLSLEEYSTLRQWLSSEPITRGDGAQVWRHLWLQTSNQARQLSERLRLVLEPTGRSRLAGDYRTGRRINMRRVIPYLASQFRKDRIWLRRTKPAKREYKICLALDDSSSMSDNRSKELAFESLALVSQALNLLESGDLSVLSFGEKPTVLHPFTEQFSENSSSKILDRLRFDQTKTKIAQLLDFATVMFEELSVRSDTLNAKLLVIISDGRGIYSEGETRVIHAVRRARQLGIFLVYLIIDNPDNKYSIMDIRTPSFNPDTKQLDGFQPYLDTFPFPYYLILRDISALPSVLGDALRQWFELAANNAC